MKMIIYPSILLLLSIALGNFGEAANILAMYPSPVFSHTVSYMPIFRELALRGHNVTVVSTFPQKIPVPNLTDIVIPNIAKDMMCATVGNSFPFGSLRFQMLEIWDFGLYGTEIALKLEPIKRLIADNDTKFDLILMETTYIFEAFVAFGHKFNAPVINGLSLFFFPRSAYLSGNHFPTSYVSTIIHFAFNDRMSFIERLQNSFYYTWDILASQLYYLEKQDALMRKHFVYPGSENLPPINQLLSNAALTFIEHDAFGIGYPVPLHKNVIPFSGVNLKDADKLPEDLQKYMDDNKDGVILFSMGSFFSILSLNPHIHQMVISALSKLKLKVIMKLNENELVKGSNTNNILIRSWLPQRSILAHPNCKLFITHGGLHGTMEGVYHGVPMVALPLVVDQRYNAKFIETTGIGIGLDIFTLTEEKFIKTIKEVLNNPKYKENIRKRSTILKDTPMNTMDNLIYWIEYVIRHKGAPHLRPAVLDLHWYQHLMLDVISFFLFLILLLIYIIKTVLSLLFKCLRYLFCRKTYKKLKKSKKE